LQVEWDLPPALAHCEVPALLLQPLVENAIKHGLEPQRGGGRLRLSARRDGEQLVLLVSDTGAGLEGAHTSDLPGTGFGLTQVRERLRTLYGDLAGLTLRADEAGGTLAEVHLPCPLTASSRTAP
jgi:sensor histidine kinase YesM